MKLLRYLPIAYFAGAHGFALFAPYLALMLAGGHLLRQWQRRRGTATIASTASVPFPVSQPDLPLPAAQI